MKTVAFSKESKQLFIPWDRTAFSICHCVQLSVVNTKPNVAILFRGEREVNSPLAFLWRSVFDEICFAHLCHLLRHYLASLMSCTVQLLIHRVFVVFKANKMPYCSYLSQVYWPYGFKSPNDHYVLWPIGFKFCSKFYLSLLTFEALVGLRIQFFPGGFCDSHWSWKYDSNDSALRETNCVVPKVADVNQKRNQYSAVYYPTGHQ